MEREVIVFFDGECHLCDGVVRFILDRDEAGVFSYAAQQSAWAQSFLEEHGMEDPQLDSIILYKRGSFYVLSDAVIEIAREMPGFWRVFTVLGGLPRPWRHGLYRWVARNRYRWFGRRAECRLPQPGEAERFLG